MRHWYGARFGDRLLRVDGASAVHFQQCATLVDQIPCYQLRRAHSADGTLELADMVQADLMTAWTASTCSGHSGMPEQLARTARR